MTATDQYLGSAGRRHPGPDGRRRAVSDGTVGWREPTQGPVGTDPVINTRSLGS